MFVLSDLLNTPLYENFIITIYPQWLDMFALSIQTNIDVFCDIDDDESCGHNNEDRFEEKQEEKLINKIMQNILSSK
jgi:hypothetical protein